MQLLVFGATGRTGSAIVRQALAAGHSVAAFVRNRGGVIAGVDVHTGDVLVRSSVVSVVRAEHTIVVTLGGVDAMTTGCANVVAAAIASGARRLLGVVGAGVLQADATHRRSDMPDYPPHLRSIGAAHQAFCDALRASSLDWTLACTPRLVDGPRSDAFRVRADYLPDGTGAISTGDVAAFLLAEATALRFVRTRVGINSAEVGDVDF